MDGARKSRGLFDSSIASCFSRCFPSAILLLAKSKTGYGELGIKPRSASRSRMGSPPPIWDQSKAFARPRLVIGNVVD